MISIIIPTYNGKDLLIKCLNSIKKQTYNGKLEIIIIDNNSNDKTNLILKKQYKSVKYILLDKNYGFAKAVNIGINASNGNYILLLNNDIILEKNFINEIKKGLDEFPEAGFCASKILQMDSPDNIYSVGNIYSNNGTASLRGFGEKKEKYKNFEYIFGACAAAAIYRKSLFDNIGLFDEDFFAYYEDVDFDWRAQLAGYKCILAPNAISYHIGSATSNKMGVFKTYYGSRNILLVLFKDVPRLFILKNLINILILQHGRLIFNIFRGQFFITIKAILDAFKMIFKMNKKRKKIYQDVKVSDKYLNLIINNYSLRNYLRTLKRKLNNK